MPKGWFVGAALIKKTASFPVSFQKADSSYISQGIWEWDYSKFVPTASMQDYSPGGYWIGFILEYVV